MQNTNLAIALQAAENPQMKAIKKLIETNKPFKFDTKQSMKIAKAFSIVTSNPNKTLALFNKMNNIPASVSIIEKLKPALPIKNKFLFHAPKFRFCPCCNSILP